jgi:chromodomain-helicase-DNA-binding protein 4
VEPLLLNAAYGSQTPLNNNLRELFNLMNFIDPENWPVEVLEQQYQQDLLTPALVTGLHEKLKNYFLRRTKEILNLPQKASIGERERQ